jgi:Flp pilus assembly protein TadD
MTGFQFHVAAPGRHRSGSVPLRAARFALAMVFVLAGAACTTTVRQVSETPLMQGPGTLTSAGELRIAQTALEAGDTELASKLFGQIVQTDPRSVPGLTGLGDTLYAVGDYTRANVYYDKATGIDPKAIPALIGIARVGIRQRRFHDAISTYTQILTLVPNDPLAAAGLGAALDMAGDHAGAQAALRAALNANPGDPGLSVNLGLSLVMGGDPRDGANVLLDVTRFPEAPLQARQDLALAYGLLGNDQAAARILSHDLPKESVADDLHYYALQRARLRSGQQPSQSPHDAQTSLTAAPMLPRVGTLNSPPLVAGVQAPAL